MLEVAAPMPLIDMLAPLPLLERPIESCGVSASRSSKLSMPYKFIRSSPMAVIATGISRTLSSIALAVTTISSISAAFARLAAKDIVNTVV